MTRTESLLDALGPVRTALTERVRADAAHALAEAERDAAAVLDEARAEADALLTAARARGEEEAAAALAAEHARSRRLLRAAELRARREAYDELRRRMAERLRERCAEPEGAAIVARMTDRVRAVLGPGAVVTPVPGGGVRGAAGGRFAACSVDALVGRALDALGPAVEALWEE